MKKKVNSFACLFGIMVSLLIIGSLSGCSSDNEQLVIASGAGYKKPVMEICTRFEKETGIKPEMIFGNMQTVSTQVQQSGKVGVLIGDKSFLSNPKMGVEYSDYADIGKGKLVLAFSRNCELSGVDDITGDAISRISMPDIAKAIYGKATKEFLDNTDRWENLCEKIIPAATVPQVSSYLVSGEVDAGFINLTDAIGIQDKIGGYILIEDNYSPIEIVAGTVSGFEKESSVKKFIKFIKSEEAAVVFQQYGL